MLNISTVLRVVTATMLFFIACIVSAQSNYPDKPIRIISPNAPGGGTTILARVVGQKLTDKWGKPVVVDNRPGGNGVIGGEALARSSPDGYTMMVITTTHIITPLLQPTPYDAVNDFSAVATIGSSEQMLVVHPSVPANNLRELIELAKSRLGNLNYASAGGGSSTHLAGELFNMVAGVKIQHVPYKGSGPALIDLIGGHVQMYFGPPSNVVPHVQSGRLKAIAIGGKMRLTSIPQLPTFTEAGMANVDIKQWWGLLAPLGATKSVIAKVSNEIGKILQMPDIKEQLTELGMDAFLSSPEQFAALMKADTVLFGNIITTANIRFEK